MTTASRDAALEALERFLGGLPDPPRRLARGEYGLTVDAGGRPLHVGVALRDGLVRAQAHVLDAGRLDPGLALWWNRDLTLVRFSQTRAGELWVQGDLPLAAVDEHELDRMLGLLVRVAGEARERAARGGGGLTAR